MAPAMQDVAFVFEAAPEKLPLKQQLFAELESLTAPDTILASNSSAIPSTRIGEKLKHRERVVGTHFWNPPHLVPLVEVTQNEKTSDETVARTMTLLRDAGRNPVHVKKDIPGFVGNRLQHALKREAIALIAAGVCDADTIDEVVKSGFGARMAVLGPMEQTDLVGVDLTLDIQNVLLADLDRSTEPTQLIKDKVAPASSACAPARASANGRRNRADAVRERLRNFLAEQAKAKADPRQATAALIWQHRNASRRGSRGVLGAIFAILSAASFALNNATVRRGVVSGTPIQAMAVSVPLGVVCFLPLRFAHRRAVPAVAISQRRRWPGWRGSACCIS